MHLKQINFLVVKAEDSQDISFAFEAKCIVFYEKAVPIYQQKFRFVIVQCFYTKIVELFQKFSMHCFIFPNNSTKRTVKSME